MKAFISWWDLVGSEQSIDTMRAYIRDEGVGPWAEVPGLVVKFWISDRENERWGAVQIWENDGPGDDVPPNRATTLIGYPPTQRFIFNIEATVEGLHTLAGLAGHGLALEGPSVDATRTGATTA